jgi:hypothetical protein
VISSSHGVAFVFKEYRAARVPLGLCSDSTIHLHCPSAWNTYVIFS